MPNFFLVSFTLLQREVVRFLRQRNRIVGALGTPLIFWILIGSGLNKSFHVPSLSGAPQMDYLHYFFPGTIILILLFTAIFATISIIEDRREGFLQGVLVAPIPRAALVFGNLLGGTVLATLQGLLFLCLTPLLGIHMSLVNFLFVLLTMLLMSFGLTGLGFIMAWRLDSSQGFHALMNLFLMPLWLMSGALFPPEGAPTWLQWTMKANPLSYSLSALQSGFFGSGASQTSPVLCLTITACFALGMFILAVKTASKTK